MYEVSKSRMSDERIRPYASDPTRDLGVTPHLTDYWYILTRRLWLVVERDTLTHEIHSVRAAHSGIAAALEAEQ